MSKNVRGLHRCELLVKGEPTNAKELRITWAVLEEGFWEKGIAIGSSFQH